MEVGIREAKNNLSKLVEAVLDGQEVILTNRGEPVAQLVPARKAPFTRAGSRNLESEGQLLSRLGFSGGRQEDRGYV